MTTPALGGGVLRFCGFASAFGDFFRRIDPRSIASYRCLLNFRKGRVRDVFSVRVSRFRPSFRHDFSPLLLAPDNPVDLDIGHWMPSV